jgi:hypothetical protein
MAGPDTTPEDQIVQLNDDDVAYLMNLLRNASQPVTTQQLIDALRRQAAGARGIDERGEGTES